MVKFSEFRNVLAESIATEDKLTHLYHNEEHVINAGRAGFNHAMGNLYAVHNALTGARRGSRVKVTEKLDGSPAIIAGIHPINKKFFVATKSVFNKDPKINYTNKDIDNNHGHAPGLVSKLKLALEHLPKVYPNQGVYQCDVMFAKSDTKHTKDGISFKPNTITYTIQKNHPDYNIAKTAQLSVAVHTKYTGNPTSDYHINGMTAEFNVDYQNFRTHRDVLLISPIMGAQPEYTRTQKELVKQSLKLAREMNRKVTDKDYDATGLHDDHMRLYFNAKVRDGGQPSIGDYFNFIKARLEKDVDKMKSERGKANKQEVLDMFIMHFQNNRASFDKVFAIHGYIQKAKDSIVDALSSNPNMKNEVDGKKVKPEGFVVIKDGRPTKLVDRAEFSRLNFQNNRGRG